MRLEEERVKTINSYRGDYMSCYSWAEYSVGMFEDY